MKPSLWRTMTGRRLRAVGLVVGVVAGIALGETAGLEYNGATLVWVAVAAGGIGWIDRDAHVWRTAAGLVTGSTVSLAAGFAALATFPLTPSGRALGHGIGAAALMAIVLAARGRVRYGPAMVAFGLAIPVIQLVGPGLSTGAGDAAVVIATTAIALLTGLAGSRIAVVAADVHTALSRSPAGTASAPTAAAPAPIAIASPATVPDAEIAVSQPASASARRPRVEDATHGPTAAYRPEPGVRREQLG